VTNRRRSTPITLWRGSGRPSTAHPWKNAFFLLPLPSPHREFAFEIDGDPVSFLWHIPVSDQERAFKQELGADALLDRMGEARLPWIFEEANRPSLVD
jgi:Suppressor of fused protein (SUFU)